MSPIELGRNKWPVSHNWVLRILPAALLALAYVVTGHLCSMLSFSETKVPLFWLPSGIAVAAVLRYGYGVLPGVFLGALSLNTLSSSHPIEAGVAVAVGVTASSAAARWLFTEGGHSPSLAKRRDLVGFIGYCAVFSPILSSCLGVAALVLAGITPGQSVWQSWLYWWIDDVIGVLIAGIPLLAWMHRESREQLSSRGTVRAIALMCSTIVLTLLIFLGSETRSALTPAIFLPFLMLSWLAGSQQGFVWGSIGTFFVSLIAVCGTLQGLGPFYENDVQQSMIFVWAYMATLVFVVMSFTIITQDMRLSEKRLEMALEHSFTNVWEYNVADDVLSFSSLQWVKLLGLSGSVVENASEAWLRLVHPQDREQARQALIRHLRDAAPAYVVEYRILCADGRYLWVRDEGKVSERDELRRPLKVLGLQRNVDERRQMESSLHAQKQLNDTIIHMQEQFIRENNAPEIFQLMLNDVIRLTQSEFGIIGEILHDSAGQPYLRSHAMTDISWDEQSKAKYEAHKKHGFEVHNLDNMLGACLVTGKPVVINDVAGHLYGMTMPRAHPPIHAFLGIPLILDGQLVGLCGLANRADGYSDSQLESLAPVVSTAANLIHAWRAENRRSLAEKALKEGEERLSLALRAADLGLWDWHVPSGEVTFNQRWADILHYADPALSMSRASWEDSIHPDDKHLVEDALAQHLAGATPQYEARYRIKGPDGVWVKVLDQGKVFEHDNSGSALRLVGTIQDITQYSQHQEQLEKLAHYDVLTGLPNRVTLQDRLETALAQARRKSEMLAVAYLDLDGFKPINDTYGHEAGDKILVEVASRLKTQLRGTDTAARLGGDEFVLLIGELTSMEGLHVALQRILKEMSKPYVVEGVEALLSGSIGVTIYPNDGSDPDTLMRHADQAMYVAKQGGRNRYQLFDAEQEELAQQNRRFVTEIHQGIAGGQMRLYYQPKVDMRRGKVVGMEALVRWAHPDGKIWAPGQFLYAIENHEVTVELGRWVMNEAVRQLSLWIDRGLMLSVSVNISPRHLQQPDFANDVRQALQSYPNVPSGMLEIEIVETAKLDGLSELSHVLNEIRETGVRIALDDFGTGYSSLTYLRQLPVDTLKIDQSFVRDMLDDPDDLPIVEGVIGLAQAFQREAIAEGVESDDHGAMLLSLGCDLGQGYGIARPMASDQVELWVSEYQPPAKWAAAINGTRENGGAAGQGSRLRRRP